MHNSSINRHEPVDINLSGLMTSDRKLLTIERHQSRPWIKTGKVGESIHQPIDMVLREE
jgi:hypothetical protein